MHCSIYSHNTHTSDWTPWCTARSTITTLTHQTEHRDALLDLQSQHSHIRLNTVMHCSIYNHNTHTSDWTPWCTARSTITTLTHQAEHRDTLLDLQKKQPRSRVVGTLVARSSSVRAVACSNLRQVPPLQACMWGSDRLHAGCQEVCKCSTRGESWGMYITFASAKIANKAEPTLALKPRGDLTRNPKQGYQWPQKRTCVRPKKI